MVTDRHAAAFRPLIVAATSGLITAALFAAGCGPPADRDAPSGTVVTQAGVRYAVQTSRELNPESADDRAFLGGLASRKQLDPPGMTLVGVFLQASNGASTPRTAVAAPELVTASRATFKPVVLPRNDPFAYRGRRLAPGEQIPGGQSIARESPETGVILVYRMPTDVFITDRPFTVRFGTDARAASVQLDI